jgi:asparagine synthase (glutamine-hydrolysing)
MLQDMNYRGPDGQGEFIKDEIAIGMVRLAIVGSSGGNQPIWNEDNSICVIVNGEIYNHLILKGFLLKEGHRFQTSSDVEVLVHLYEHYGKQFIEQLEGIFAFALWDKKHNLLIVGRDRIGIKPLFFLENENEFCFASELTVLMSEGEQYHIDETALSEYHSCRFVPGRNTIVSEIKKIPPAHYAEICDGQMKSQIYWRPEKARGKEHNLQPDKADQLLTLFRHAVADQEAPEVKSGLFLSGGLDSGALLSLQTSLYQTQPLTFTVGFDKPQQMAHQNEFDEISAAARTAELFGARHITEKYSAKEVLSQLPHIIAALDEPIADPTAIPLWFVSKLANQAGCKVVYSGEGLDEIFLGYSVYGHGFWLQRLQLLPKWLRRAALNCTSRFNLSGKGILDRSLHSVRDWYHGVGGAFTLTEQASLFLPHFQLSTVSPSNPFIETSGKDIVKQMSDFDFYNWLPDNTLAKSDKISMAHSLELRVPFLNTSVVEYAQHLPVNQKRRGKVGKWAARQALNQILPSEIYERRKVGFPVPISAWIYGEWRQYVSNILFDPKSKTRYLYRRNEIEKLFNAEGVKRERGGRLLWTLFTLEMWLQCHPNVKL